MNKINSVGEDKDIDLEILEVNDNLLLFKKLGLMDAYGVMSKYRNDVFFKVSSYDSAKDLFEVLNRKYPNESL